jgi:transposase
MARAYSQDLRDRVLDAVEQGMSRSAAARRFGVSRSAAIKWINRYRRDGARTPVGAGGHRPCVLKPHRDFVEAVLAEQPDITLEALGRCLLAERAVRADTSMLSRFLRREGITFKKRRWWRRNGSAQTSAATGRDGANTRGGSMRRAWCSSTRRGPGPT